VDFKGFLPNGFFERVVNRLVCDWSKSYPESNPLVTHNAACLSMGGCAVALVLDRRLCTICAFARAGEAARIMPHVRAALVAVNEEVYSGRILFDVEGMDDGIVSVRCQSEAVGAPPTGASTEVGEQPCRVHEALAVFFASCALGEADANRCAQLVVEEASDVDALKLWHTGDSNDLKDFLQKDCGIKRGARSQIMGKLEKLPDPPDPEEYLLGFFGGDSLAHVEKERIGIENTLKMAKLLVTSTLPMGPVERIYDLVGTHSVMHLAMHGQQKTASGKSTLAFDPPDSGLPVEPQVLADVIASVCKRDDGEESGRIECVVINACSGFEIAELLKSKKHSVPWVVAWTTPVDDEAARAFAEEFYSTLSRSRGNYANAYECAITRLTLRQWVIDEDAGDPQSGESRKKLRERQKDENNLLLTAAGVPKLYPSRQGSSTGGDGKEAVLLAPLLRIAEAAEQTASAAVSLDDAVKVGFARVELNQQELLRISRATRRLAGALALGEIDCPKYVLIVPDTWHNEKSTGFQARLASALDKAKHAIRNLHATQLRLVLLCAHDFQPVECGPDGKGYPIKIEKDWVKKLFRALGPIIWLGLTAAKVALVAASAGAVTVPGALNVNAGAGDAGGTGGLDGLALGDAFGVIDSMKDAFGDVAAAATEEREVLAAMQELEECGGGGAAQAAPPASDALQAATGTSYRELQKFLRGFGEPLEGHVGLKKVESQGVVAWVAPANEESWRQKEQGSIAEEPVRARRPGSAVKFREEVAAARFQ
jgi:hypothetical protein